MGASRTTLALLLPSLLFCALYLRGVDYEFVWTDEPEYAAGSVIRPPGRILEAFQQPLHYVEDSRARFLVQPYYRPLQVVTVSVLDDAFGRTPRTFRAASLLLGAVAVALFSAFACWLLGPAAGLLAGAAVAAHPAGIEIYQWVSGLSAALGNCFILASLLLGGAALQSRRAGARLATAAGSLAALILGLLSKENAAVTPGLLLALAVSLGVARRSGTDRRGLAVTAAALILSQVVVVFAYVLAWRPQVLGTAFTGAPPIGGSQTTQLLTSLAFWPRSLTWLFLPLRSNTSDAVRVVTSPFDPAVLAGVAIAVASLALWIVWLRRGKVVAALGVAWIWVAFLPTSGVVPLLHASTERNLYLAVYGAALLWGSAAAALHRTQLPRAAVIGLALLLVGGLAWRTATRLPDWRTTTTLFERDVASDPRHREGRFNLVIEYASSGRLDEAKRHVDILVAQRGERTAWTSYLLDEPLFEIHCRVSAATDRGADTLAMYDTEVAASGSGVWSRPGYVDCVAPALERVGRLSEARGLYEQLHRSDGPAGRAEYAVAVARCHALEGDAKAAREWLARVPVDPPRRRGLSLRIAQVRELLRRASEDSSPH